MKYAKEHIIFRITTIVLVVSLLIPSAVKFSHIFSHHNHEVCLGETSTHIHKVDLDCEFYKFQLNNHFLLPEKNNNWSNITHHYQASILTYHFFYNHQQLSFSLRGPPVLV